MVSFRGQKKKGLRPDRSHLGVLFTISDEHPTPFMCGDPPPPGINPTVQIKSRLVKHFADIFEKQRETEKVLEQKSVTKITLKFSFQLQWNRKVY